MAILTKVITASVGFAFTFGAFGKATAQEAKLAKNGTVVLARENHRPTRSTALEELRKSVMQLASTDAQKPTKGTKTKTKSPTKPTKRKNI